MVKHIVTFAPPTPNGELHVGHLSGPYLAADVYCRAFRMLGDEVVFVSYSDEYHSYLQRKALELDEPEAQVATRNYQAITEALTQCRIEPDLFTRSRNQKAFLNAVAFFRQHADAYITLKEDQVPYCKQCQRWGFEAYARGRCPQCGASTDRSQCEGCASAPEISGINDMTCVHCHEPVEYRTVIREYLSLDVFRALYRDLAKRPGIRAPLTDFLNSQLSHTSLDWPIDRPEECGVPCDTAHNTLLSTWFCGVAGYYGATDELNQKDIWNELAHCSFFVGFDCSFSHALVYPALMKAANLKAVDDLRIYTNAFLKLDGMDFSTSRGIAIWAKDLLDHVDADYVRFYLALFSPELETSNFETDHFCQYVVEHLHAPLQAWWQKAKQAQQGVTIDSHLAQSWLNQWHTAIALENHSMKKLATVLANWLEQKPYESMTPEQALTTLTLWALLAYPLMPQFSDALWLSADLKKGDSQQWLTNPTSPFPLSSNGLSDYFVLPDCNLDAAFLKTLYNKG